MAEDIAEDILRAIIEGTMVPGDSLPPEADLAEKFGASRMTIREAIRILRTQNVVHINRGRGTEVNRVEVWTSLDAIMRVSAGNSGSTAFVADRLLEARRMIEVGAVQLAAERRTEADLERLAECIAAMQDAAERDDIDAVVEADIRFHDVILHASGNLFVPLLFDSFGPLLVQIRRKTSSIPAVRERALHHHEAILAALTAADQSEARTAMERHLLPEEGENPATAKA